MNMADFGDILRTIGDFGLFQKLILFGLCFPNLVLPFHLASLIFIQSDPERHCNTDWVLRAASNLSSEEQLNLTVPRQEDGTFSRCLMFTPVDWDIDTIREHGLNQTTDCQNGWVYNKTVYEATIVTDFDLVCGKANVVGLAQTVFMAGILLGSLLFGPFAESFGRQRATQIPMVIMLIFTVTTGLSPNFYLYMASQFLVGISYGGFRINLMIININYNCKMFCLFCVSRFIPESARWLLDQGEIEEAKKLILRVAAINKRPVPETILEMVKISLNLSYYCLSFNVGNFGLNIFLTQLMFGLTEIPGHILCIFILEYLGRKISLMSTLLTGGFTCFLILAVPQDNAVAITALATAGRFFMNNAGSICNVYVQELFPTSVRQTATGLGSVAIRIAGMLSPMLNILDTYHWSIPTVVFSSLSLAGGALVFLLPETRRTELPDSTDEAEGKR
uniref:Solute carrier family 22 member 13a n=1 Tax=Hucho hucho TaxID=62062 RepID=A0A4W5RQ64_9TELE